MNVLVINQTRQRVPKSWLERWCRALARRVPRLKNKEAVIVFVSPSQIRRLNREFRGKDKPTDVLSFESAEKGVVGEIVLCLNVIREQSKRTGLPPRGELGYMVIHGLLHRLGYEHDSEKGRKKMFALQDRLYAELSQQVGLR